MSIQLQLVLALIIKIFLADNILTDDISILKEYKRSASDRPFPAIEIFKILFHGILTILVTVSLGIEWLFITGIEAGSLFILFCLKSEQIYKHDLTWVGNIKQYKFLCACFQLIHACIFILLINTITVP